MDKLKIQLNTVEKAYEQIDHSEDVEFNALVPSCEQLLELAIDSWRIVHVLYPLHSLRTFYNLSQRLV